MSKIYKQEITNCENCPNLRMYVTADESNEKNISVYQCYAKQARLIEDIMEIPYWCPLEDKESNNA